MRHEYDGAGGCVQDCARCEEDRERRDEELCHEAWWRGLSQAEREAELNRNVVAEHPDDIASRFIVISDECWRAEAEANNPGMRVLGPRDVRPDMTHFGEALEGE